MQEPVTANLAAADVPHGLPALEARLARDIELLAWPRTGWVPPTFHDGQRVHDVVIIGAGQAGLAAAIGLRQVGIEPLLLDRAPAGSEGPWATTARMETLRSPKELTGPAMRLPALTFRAWFEAQFGAAAWEALDKIPRLQWMDYLRWVRRAMALPVRNGVEVQAVLPQGATAEGAGAPTPALVRLDLRTPAGGETLWARRVVLATGRDGLGGPALPAFVSALPRERWAHSSDVLDFATLAGRRVGVVGAGSSAMDCAATALEAGCAGVDFLIRRADLPRVNKGKGAGNPGLTHGHHLLSDAQRWRVRHYINAVAVPPPRGSTLRVSSHGERVRFHFNAPVQHIAFADGALRVDTPQGRFTFDFLFVATGFVIDWRQRPELAAIAPHVRTWQDRFTPPAGMAGDRELRDSPDLGPAFEFQEKQAGTCPGLDHIHNFNYPAALSHGTVSGDIPAISTGAARLAQGIASLLYAEDFEQHYAAMVDYAEPELLGDEWVPAPAGGGGYSEH